MILQGQYLGYQNLNNAYISKTTTNSQTVSGNFIIGGGALNLKNSVFDDNYSTGYLRIAPQNNKMILYNGVSNQRLDIYGSSGTDSIYLTALTGSPSYGLLSTSTDHLEINTDNNKKVIFGTGNVGIGTNTPSHMLDVNGSGNFNGGVTVISLNGIHIAKSSTAPASPIAGDRWFDTTANRWKEYNGTSWLDPLKLQ